MAGVYIPGMEMPTTCCHCAFMYFDPDAANSNNGNPGTYLCSFSKEEIWNTQRDPQCPLIPVPDHGRLIDADAFERRCMFDRSIEDMQDVIYAIRDYPPIIPASRGGENE